MIIDRKLNYGRHVLREFIKTKKNNSNYKILDIGAGSGDDLTICKDTLPFSQLYALECYPPNLNILKSKGFSVNSINIENEKIPFNNEYFDFIISNQVLEHCKEIFWIFHEVSRTLKVNGEFYIGVPNLASLHSRLLLQFGMQPTSIQLASAHVRAYTKHGLLKFLNNCAPELYKLNHFKGSNFYPFPPFLANPLSTLFPNSSACIFLVFQKTRIYKNEFLKYPVGLETNYFLG